MTQVEDPEVQGTQTRRPSNTFTRVFVEVNVLGALAWVAIAVAGVSMANLALSVGIYVVVMAVWGVSLGRRAVIVRRPYALSEDEIQREIGRLS
jgi:uncharacterized membrane protein